MSVDIEGNCRFVDLMRLRKMAKASSSNTRDADFRFGPLKSKWRLLPNQCMEVSEESFIVTLQSFDAAIPEGFDEKYLTENLVFGEGKFSGDSEKLKRPTDIVYLLEEGIPFVLLTSNVGIFRLEDLILQIYPSISSMKRKGNKTKDLFMKHDPESQSQNRESSMMNQQQFLTAQPANQDLASMKSGQSSKFLSYIIIRIQQVQHFIIDIQ